MGVKPLRLDDDLKVFLADQHMFFVATAPASLDGHINLSPKGLDTFRVLDPVTVAYADFVGSGIETVAHLKENGRIVLMFCAFTGPPRIVRLHGIGEAIEPHHPDYNELSGLFPPALGMRAIIRVRCNRIADSCGFGVPLYQYLGQRTQMLEWAQRKGAQQLIEYQRAKNLTSIDGLPGIELAE